MTRVRIVGVHSSGKGVLSTVMHEALPWVNFSSFPRDKGRKPIPVGDVDFLVVAHRGFEDQARSAVRRGFADNWAAAVKWVVEGRTETEEYVAASTEAGVPMLRVHYRDLVERTDWLIDQIARFVGVEPWVTQVELFDGDLPRG